MTAPSHQGAVLRGVSLLAGLLGAAIGAVVLAGWIFDTSALKSAFPVGRLVCGLAVALLLLSLTLLSLGSFFLNAGTRERARAEEKTAWLASFPERNPNPIVELDPASGVIHYMNSSVTRLFSDLQSQGLRHPWLAGLEEVAGTLPNKPGESARREVVVAGFFYAQAINYIPETKRLRIYGTDITERKRAEVFAAQLVAIVESSDDAIIGKDLQGIVTSWNPGAERLFGYAAGEMVGQPIMRLIPVERQREETEILSRIQRGESIKHFDTLRLRKDGSVVPISVTVSPIKDSTGKIIGASKVARDITERQQAEASRRASEARYRTLFEYAPDGIVISDPASFYIDANATMCRMLGYTHDEMIGLHATDIVAPTEVQHIAPALGEITARTDHHREWQFRRKDGSLFAAEVIATMMPDGNLMGMIRDVTERKRTEEQLKASYKEVSDLKAALDEHAIVAITDPRGRITYVNDKFCEISKYAREELLGQDHRIINSGYHSKEFIRGLWTTIARGQVWHGEIKNKARDGSFYWVDTTIVPFLDEHGKPRHYVAIRADISERKRAEEALRESYENLERKVAERTVELQLAKERSESAGRAKSEFMASMSHELRTPLNGIIGFSEFLVDGKPGALNPKQKEYLEDILNSGRHLLQLINDVLDLAKVEAGKIEFNPEPFPLRKAIEEVRAVAGPIAQKKRLQVDVTIAPELDEVTLDQIKFKQVVYNLLSNALKFTDSDGRVDIRCAPIGLNHFTLAVKDSGIGIKPEDLARLFKEFEQIDSGAGRRYEGTGLGLALTRKIVELQGGGITVESESGKGSTFTVTLPLVFQEVKT